MKIALVHNRYRERGGEDVVVEAQAALLRGHGHDVVLYQRDNDDLQAMAAPAAAWQALWSRRTVRELGALLRHERPDVVHLHNSWPLVSASVCAAARAAGVPLVATLHNYRLACAQAMFLRDGRVCTDCLGRVPWPAIRHACYRGSRAQTAVLVAVTQTHRMAGTWTRGVARWIALSQFSRQTFVAAGLPADRLDVVPNFVDDPGTPAPMDGRAGLLFVGRLSSEKGLATLAAACRLAPGVQVDVIGDGPDAALLSGQPQVRMLGAQPPAAVLAAMRRARALLMPSLSFEHSPRVLVEAMACGLPVVASRIGALAEVIGSSGGGWLVPPGDAPAWSAAMQQAAQPSDEAMHRAASARQAYEARHTPQMHLDALLRVYAAARLR